MASTTARRRSLVRRSFIIWTPGKKDRQRLGLREKARAVRREETWKQQVATLGNRQRPLCRFSSPELEGRCVLIPVFPGCHWFATRDLPAARRRVPSRVTSRWRACAEAGSVRIDYQRHRPSRPVLSQAPRGITCFKRIAPTAIRHGLDPHLLPPGPWWQRVAVDTKILATVHAVRFLMDIAGGAAMG